MPTPYPTQFLSLYELYNTIKVNVKQDSWKRAELCVLWLLFLSLSQNILLFPTLLLSLSKFLRENNWVKLRQLLCEYLSTCNYIGKLLISYW